MMTSTPRMTAQERVTLLALHLAYRTNADRIFGITAARAGFRDDGRLTGKSFTAVRTGTGRLLHSLSFKSDRGAALVREGFMTEAEQAELLHFMDQWHEFAAPFMTK